MPLYHVGMLPVDFGTDPWLRRYKNMVVAIASRTAAPGSDEFEDLCQAGVLGLYEARRTFRKKYGTKFSTWAFTIVRDKVQRAHIQATVPLTCSWRTVMKASPVQVPMDSPEYTQPLEDTSPGPDEAMMLAEEHGERCNLYCKLWAGLNRQMGREDREVVIAHFVEGKTIRALNKQFKKDCGRIVREAKRLMLATAGRVVHHYRLRQVVTGSSA